MRHTKQFLINYFVIALIKTPTFTEIQRSNIFIFDWSDVYLQLANTCDFDCLIYFLLSQRSARPFLFFTKDTSEN